MFKLLKILSVVVIAMPGTIAAASPREVAEAFLGHILAMETHKAIEMVAEPDRSAPSPLGRHNAFVSDRPRFPSRWSFEVVFAEERDGEATVGISIIHPEIEDSLGRVSSTALEELALKQYFLGKLEMTRTELEVSLVEMDTGQWGVKTFADEDDWWRYGRYPPKADVMAMNRDEILDYQAKLMERFPHRSTEISELVEPELAILEAAEGLTFSNLSVVDDRTREQPRFREPGYDIRLKVTNGSPHTITRISGQLVFRNAAGVIVDTSTWLFSESDVPAGLKQGETFSEALGVKINNIDAEVTEVEVQVSDVTIR